MKTIIINKNDENQRLDRFLTKYLKNAKKTLIMKSLRKKNITLNGKKASPEEMIKIGDEINIFFSDETIEKFTEDKKIKTSEIPDILYEDENILLVKKPSGLLTHNDKKEYEKNALDSFINYLIRKKEFVPRIEKSFRPAFSNRLDRNTSGILIGCKNAEALREINSAIKNRKLDKYYLALVHGNMKEEIHDKSILSKDEKKNKVTLKDSGSGKTTETIITPMENFKDYTLVKVNLITGRTHQIRATLKKHGFSIVGDAKYSGKGDFGLKNQFLHNYKIVFDGLEKLNYLNGKEFTMELEDELKSILKGLR